MATQQRLKTLVIIATHEHGTDSILNKQERKQHSPWQFKGRSQDSNIEIDVRYVYATKNSTLHIYLYG